MQNKTYYTYIVANKINTVLYIGVTNNIVRRIYEHRNYLIPGFTSKYKVNKLVYYEAYDGINEAIAREKQLKGGSRRKKIELINKINPNFDDLFDSII